MTTRKIGIPVSKTGENSVGLTLSYIEFAEQYGEVVLLMPNHTIRRDLDLLILPGGADIDPRSYSAVPSWFTGKPDLYKEYFDARHLPAYVANGTPIFGICRGFQAIGVFYGARLIQHMNHETNKPEDPYKCVHKVALNTELFPNYTDFTPATVIEVNSRHHQTININTIPVNSGLKVIGSHSTKAYHPEIIAHETLPIVGWQSHPEDIGDAATCGFVDNIIEHLITRRTSILRNGL